MTPLAHAANFWLQGGHRSYQNAVLHAGYLEFLKPAGIVCDYLTYDPTAAFFDETSALVLIRPAFQPRGVEIGPMKDLLGGLGPMIDVVTYRLESPHSLELRLGGASSPKNIAEFQAAHAVIEGGLGGELSLFLEQAADGFRESIDLAFALSASPDTDPVIRQQFISGPVAFYRGIVAEMAAIATTGA